MLPPMFGMSGTTSFFASSGCANPGKGLRVVAKSPDGIIEGTDTTDPNRFLIGLQGHPKKLMPEDNLNEKLIQAFIDSSPEGKK